VLIVSASLQHSHVEQAARRFVIVHVIVADHAFNVVVATLAESYKNSTYGNHQGMLNVIHHALTIVVEKTSSLMLNA